MVSQKHLKPFSSCKDLKTLSPNHFADDRGLFSTLKIWPGIEHLNISKSNSNVLRGLHYQSKNPQGKIVWCISGYGIDLALDIRLGSKTYGEVFNYALHPGEAVFVPRGFAHGIVSMDKLQILYGVDSLYEKEFDTGINVESIPCLSIYLNFKRSDKDKNLPMFNAEKMVMPI